MLQTLPMCLFSEEGCYLILSDIDDQIPDPLLYSLRRGELFICQQLF